MLFDGNYLNGEKNGNGKEYNNKGELIYEGNYLENKKNGEGKVYKEGKLVFKGEYLNGQKNGKGKEYYDGKLIFEGEYKDGKKWNGKGKEYANNEDNIIIISEYKDGKILNSIGEKNGNLEFELIQGKGNYREYNSNGKLIFDGYYFNTKRWEGIFKQYDDNFLIFEGEYINGNVSGKGKILNEKKNLYLKVNIKMGKDGMEKE